MAEKLSRKQLEGQWRLSDEEYEYFLTHGITIEEYLMQKNEACRKELEKGKSV